MALKLFRSSRPNHLHAATAIPFLKCGIHVICDKPLAATMDQARELAAAVRESDALFVLTHNYSAYPLIRQARDIVLSGEIGEIRFVHVEYATDWLSRNLETTGLKQAEWRTDPARAGAGGCVADIGTHAHHLATFVTGLTVESLTAELVTFVPGRQVDDHVQAQLRFNNGPRGILWASQIAIGEENKLHLRVFGSDGSVEWQQENPNQLWLAKYGQAKRLVTRMGASASAESSRLSRVPAGLPEGYLEGFANIYSEAADAIFAARAGKPKTLPDGLPGLEEGLAGMSFVEACIRSSSQGGNWVTPISL